ncbi:MAG: hypothetical protein P4M11_11900 [Candidatus Pacebacteria bacterium]|nr:hypothetical protein [Candidatus Paceibacterota bacterium]
MKKTATKQEPTVLRPSSAANADTLSQRLTLGQAHAGNAENAASP